jgi:hypothetical protein
MRSARIYLWLLVISPALPVAVVHASTINCEGGLVSTGDPRIDLLAKCGEPTAREYHDEEVSERLDPITRRRAFITVEEWTYNFGPSSLQRIVTLRDGKVAAIRTGNYGYGKTGSPDRRECSEQVVTVGDLKSDVFAKCGEPATKDIRQEEVKRRTDSTHEQSVFITIEEWTYNLGPNRFLRVLTFRNGKLTDIKTGGYGYPMKEEEKRKAP